MKEDNPIKLFHEAMESGRSAALATIVSAQGSTPRETGAKMVVYEDGSIGGTVGGGKLEAACIREALAALKKGESRKISLDLTKAGLGMACMGRVEVFIDVHAVELKLLILGAGHVGIKIAEAARLAGVPYAVADDREDFANKLNFPSASAILALQPHAAVRRAGVDEKTRIVIVTRGHSLDQECLEAALKTRAPYIGMIGSRSKVAILFKNLNKKGLHPEKDPRVYSPVGLDIGGKTPGAIAISVLAEILKLHNGRPGTHMALARPFSTRAVRT